MFYCQDWATAEFGTFLCVAAAAATPTIKLAVEINSVVGSKYRRPGPSDPVDQMFLRMAAKAADHLLTPAHRLKDRYCVFCIRDP
jgi:hypothetical protein